MDSDTSLYENLLIQCRSNGTYAAHERSWDLMNFTFSPDVDVKVEALTKLQALFEPRSSFEVRGLHPCFLPI